VRLFPDEPRFQSAAEQVVWRALQQQLPDESVLFHGLRFSDRRHDREADIVAAVPGVGIAVLEVKGGQITLEAGSWVQVGRGIVRPVDPIGQARTCKYLLRDYLNRHPGWGHGNPRIVHLVAFPFTVVPPDFSAPDCPRWMVAGHDDLDDLGARVVDALTRAEDQPLPPTKEQVEDLIGCLAGRMIPHHDLVAEIREREAANDLLTTRQGHVLDLIQHLNRVEVLGGAGTGKTWLAVEKARRLAAAGQRVGLICYSRGLADYLRHRTSTFPDSERPAYVGTFHGLGTGWLAVPEGRDDDPPYWDRFLPQEMARAAAARPAGERFDAIVVDEAQDFADTWWPAVLAALRDSDIGGLFTFADEGQRVFARQGRPPVSLVPIALSENLRNTRQIARAFDSLAPLRMRYRGGDGAPVRFVPATSAGSVPAAGTVAAGLREEGWEPGHIAILTTGDRHPAQDADLARGHDEYWRAFREDARLFHGHVLGFKGLERPAVVLAVNGFHDRQRAREMLYVGMSRARDLLVVIGDPDLLAQVGGSEVARRIGIGAEP
jgi:hypothetical protein